MLDCDSYRVNVPAIKALLEEKKTEDARYDMIGLLSITTGVPIIIVACYVGELYGFTPYLIARVQRLMNFYAITRVKNTTFDFSPENKQSLDKE